MADLVVKTAISTIEKALKNTLLLAVGRRLPVAATVAAVRATPTGAASPSTDLKGDELVYCTAQGVTYQFSRGSTAADDGVNVLRPADNPANGRWLRTTSTVASGYAQQVRVHLGEESYKLMLLRAQAQRPSIHILFDEVRYKDMSMARGALYWAEAKFRVIAISSSLRQSAQAAEGSDYPPELVNDPGAHSIIGDAIVTLAGSDLGSTAGVAYCEVNDERYKVTEIGGRLLAEEIGVRVFFSVHQPETGLGTIDALSGMTVQRQILDGGAYDPNNYRSSGYNVATGGLTQTPTPGVATVAGATVSSSPGSFTFAANSDTYRDLTAAGTLLYAAVPNGQNAPTQRVGTLRIGVTVTSALAVIYDRILAPSLVNFRAADWVPGAGLGVSSVAITPGSPSFTTGQTQKFTATATYSDGHTADISSAVTWASSNAAVATIAYDGTATWTGVGVSTISCSLDGLAGGNTATLTGA